MKEHTRSDPSKVAKLTCPVCGEIFSHRGNLTQHLKRVHKNKKFTCQFCDKQFNSNFYMTRHLIKHLGPLQKITLDNERNKMEGEEDLGYNNSAIIPTLVRIGINDPYIERIWRPWIENENQIV